jgi:hypothetical protein
MSSHDMWSQEPGGGSRGGVRCRRHLSVTLPALVLAWAILLMHGCTDKEHLVGPDETVLLEPLLVTAANTTDGVEYETVVVGHLPGNCYDWIASWIAEGTSLNGLGQIVGYSGCPFRAVVWDEAGGMRSLGFEGFESCLGLGINDSGVSVGYCRTQEGQSKPVLWDGTSEGTMPQVLSLSVDGVEYFGGFARAINANGKIAGTLERDGETIAVVWEGETLERLGHLQGEIPTSRGHGINAGGDVLGESAGNAVVWLAGEKEPTALPGGENVPARWSINSSRDVPGGNYYETHLWIHQADGGWSLYNEYPQTQMPAFFDLTDRSGDQIRIVGAGGTAGNVWAVNTGTGQVESEVKLPLPAGFHNRLGNAEPYVINANGWIAGVGRSRNSQPYQIVLWRPVGGEPDPGDPGDPGDPSDPEDPPPGDDPAPVASFTYSCNNTATCNFTDTSTGAVVSWSWTFANADPATSNNQHPGATFKSAGNHGVQLVVTDDQGQPSEPATATVTCTVRGQLRCR